MWQVPQCICMGRNWRDLWGIGIHKASSHLCTLVSILHQYLSRVSGNLSIIVFSVYNPLMILAYNYWCKIYKCENSLTLRMVISFHERHKWSIKIHFVADPIELILPDRTAQHAVVSWSLNSNRNWTKEKTYEQSGSARFLTNHSYFAIESAKGKLANLQWTELWMKTWCTRPYRYIHNALPCAWVISNSETWQLEGTAPQRFYVLV